jgi:hypothetical protein
MTASRKGVNKFIEWIKNKKLEIRAILAKHSRQTLHHDIAEGDRDTGRIITGSSNFTQAGLIITWNLTLS